jgi:hypothetical protein
LKSFRALAAAAALAAVAGCTTHAPVRSEASPVATSAERLATAEGRREAAAHSVEVHPEFTLAVVEFDDQGRFWDRRQLELLESTLEAEAARPEVGGVIVGVFAHGWQHDGSLCDQNVACFRTFLRQIARDGDALRRASNGRVVPRRVVGVFVSWRGRSATVRPLSDLTFWARKRVAHKIGSGDLIELLTRVDVFVKRQNVSHVDRARLVIIGHSFGGTMVFDALANILKQRVTAALVEDRRAPGHAVIEGFGDLVVLVNPAFEAALYRSLHDLSRSFHGFAPQQGTVLVIVASETDMPNKTWFPLGRALETVWEKTARKEDGALLRTAVGNYEAFFGYRLTAAPGAARPPAPGASFGAPDPRCLCELPLEDVNEEQLVDLARRVAALGSPEPADASPAPGALSRFGRAELARLGDTDPKNPFWVVRASDEVIHGHSGFFTNAYTDFVRGVVLEAVSRRTRPATIPKGDS